MLLAAVLPLPTIVALGVVYGAAYAIMAMGIVAIYKATRVPNLAIGATASFIALFQYEAVGGHRYALNFNYLFIHLHMVHFLHPSFWEMMPVRLIAAALLGLLIERLIMRPFADSSTITLLIVSLGVALVLEGLAGRLFGIADQYVTNAEAPFSRAHTVRVLGLSLTYEMIGILAISLAVAGGIVAWFRWSRTGLAIRALAMRRDVAQICGVSARKLSILAWVGGTMLAGLVGILLSAVEVTVNSTSLTSIAVIGFVAAVIGGMSSLPIAFAAGIGVGIIQQLVEGYFPTSGLHIFGHTFFVTGMPTVAAVLVALALLASRPKWIFGESREEEESGVTSRPLSRLPWLARAIEPVQAWRSWRAALGKGWSFKASRDGSAVIPLQTSGGQRGSLLGRTHRWNRSRHALIALAGLTIAVGWPVLGVNHTVYATDAMLGLVYLMLALSIVVLTGWVGQISLAQGGFIAVGGVGTIIGAENLHLPFPLPVIFAALFSVPFSLLLGAPSLRLKGLYFAIASLAFGYAVSDFVAGNVNLSASKSPGIDFFGLHATSALGVYYAMLAVAAVMVLLCWRVSVTRPGRAFFAIRDAETVAVAYGVDAVKTKLTGFVLAGAVAAVGGSILTYVIGEPDITYTTVIFSMSWLAYVVLSGAGSIAGAFIAAGLFGLLPVLLTSPSSASGSGGGAEIGAGLLVIVVLMVNPGGLANMARFVRGRMTVHGEQDSVDIAEEPGQLTQDVGLVESHLRLAPDSFRVGDELGSVTAVASDSRDI